MDGIALAAGSVAALADQPGPGQLAASAFTWVDTGDPIPAIGQAKFVPGDLIAVHPIPGAP
jgi:hypothetical protein